ncbi:hypothetical protein ACWDTI_21595 [Gordonia sp. NPDC003424]
MSRAVDRRIRTEPCIGDLRLPDDASESTLVIGTPESLPTLWAEYIDGAYRSYSAHGVQSALNYDAVRDGHTTRLFCAALDQDGTVIGGLRIQGPYTRVEQAHAIREWAGQRGEAELIAAVAARIPGGIIECKGAYVDASGLRAQHLAVLLSRTPLFMTTITGCRYMLATAADYVLARWASGGGCIDTSVATTPYPDSRYRTRAMFWDRSTMVHDADPRVGRQMWADYHRLFGAPTDLTGPDHTEVA